MAILRLDNLTTQFELSRGTVRAVDGVSLNLEKGEMLGLIGESGCGKSTLGLSLMRLIEYPGTIAGGSIWLDDIDLMKLSPDQMRAKRWRQIALVPQSAMNALNPVLTIIEQVAEPIRTHLGKGRREAVVEAERLLELVGIGASRAWGYPHEFSGGMRQRACIAMALACNPQVLISDEATTGLDVMTQAQVVGLLRQLQQRLGLSVIFISHDLPLVLDICDRVAIMYAGQVVEVRPVADLRRTGGLHPYTKGLMQAFPPLLGPRGRAESIPGVVPSLSAPPPGCRFEPRCGRCTTDCCHDTPALRLTRDGGAVACIHAETIWMGEEVSDGGSAR